jgi:hypothetical protein
MKIEMLIDAVKCNCFSIWFSSTVYFIIQERRSFLRRVSEKCSSVKRLPSCTLLQFLSTLNSDASINVIYDVTSYSKPFQN